jgi:hypothetical protein
MQPNPWLVLSSLSFLGPAIVCHKIRNPYLMSAYMIVTIVSGTYHATKNPLLVYADYSIAQLTHAMTVFTIIPGGWASMPYYSAWLTYAVYIYYYGYLNKSMVWDSDLVKATPWHMSMHASIAITSCYTLYATHRALTNS